MAKREFMHVNFSIGLLSFLKIIHINYLTRALTNAGGTFSFPLLLWVRVLRADSCSFLFRCFKHLHGKRNQHLDCGCRNVVRSLERTRSSIFVASLNSIKCHSPESHKGKRIAMKCSRKWIPIFWSFHSSPKLKILSTILHTII